MRSEWTLFQGKQPRFEGGEAITDLPILGGQKLPLCTVVMLQQGWEMEGWRQGVQDRENKRLNALGYATNGSAGSMSHSLTAHTHTHIM